MDIIYSIAYFIIGDKNKGKGMFFMLLGYSLILTLFVIIYLFKLDNINDGKIIFFTAAITFVLLVLYTLLLIISVWASGKILGGYGSISEVGIILIITMLLGTIAEIVTKLGNYLNSSFDGGVGILGTIIAIIGVIIFIITLISWYYSIMKLQDFSLFRTIFCFIIAGFFIFMFTKIIIYIISFFNFL